VKTCHLKEPSVPFATVTSATLTLDDGTTLSDPASADIGKIMVDGKLMTQADFDAAYAVDSPLE
jgi:hypothetical protein